MPCPDWAEQAPPLPFIPMTTESWPQTTKWALPTYPQNAIVYIGGIKPCSFKPIHAAESRSPPIPASKPATPSTSKFWKTAGSFWCRWSLCRATSSGPGPPRARGPLWPRFRTRALRWLWNPRTVTGQQLYPLRVTQGARAISCLLQGPAIVLVSLHARHDTAHRT